MTLLHEKACRRVIRDPDGRHCSPDAIEHLERVVADVLLLAERMADEEGRRRVDHYHIRRALRQLYG